MHKMIMSPFCLAEAVLQREKKGDKVISRPDSMDDEYFRSQAVNLSHPVAWFVTSETLYRAAVVLHEVSEVGSKRLVELDSSRPSPAPGEIVHTHATAEESAAIMDTNLWPISLFMVASAIECRLKGYLIGNGKHKVSPEGTFERRFYTHNLRELTDMSTMNLMEDDLKILDGLTEFLEWRGRYPIPKDSGRIKKLHRMDLGDRREFTNQAIRLCDRIFSLTAAPQS